MKSCCLSTSALLFCLMVRGAVDMHPADSLGGWLDAGFGQYNPIPIGGVEKRPIFGTVFMIR